MIAILPSVDYMSEKWRICNYKLQIIPSLNNASEIVSITFVVHEITGKRIQISSVIVDFKQFVMKITRDDNVLWISSHVDHLLK